MKNFSDITILILLALVIIVAVLFFSEKIKKENLSTVQRDTVYLTDTIRPKSPPPKIVEGKTDTVFLFDSLSYTMLMQKFNDTISVLKYLRTNFVLNYEDTIQTASVTVNSILKNGLFKIHYKPISFLRPEITEILERKRFFEAFIGAGYFYNNREAYFYIDAQMRLNDNLLIIPRLSTEGVGAELKYRIF